MKRQRRGPASRHRSAYRADDLGHLARAEHGVDFGNLTAQLVTVALGQTPGHDQPPARAVLLVLRKLENGVDRLLLRGIDERACVDDEDVGGRRVTRQLVSRIAREPQHHLGIDKVLGTTKRNKAYFHVTGPKCIHTSL